MLNESQPSARTNKNKDETGRSTRRSNWAAQVEHLVPGGEQVSDARLELAIFEMLRRP